MNDVDDFFAIFYTWLHNHMHYAGIVMRLFFNNWTLKGFLNYVGFSVVLVFVTYDFLINRNVEKDYAVGLSIAISIFGHSGLRYAIDDMFEDFMKSVKERVIGFVKKQ